MATNNRTRPLFFQDVVASSMHLSQNESGNEELSLAFFRLANVTLVGYRLESCQMRPNSSLPTRSILVDQDTSACGQHTGGIVWETSYLLVNYLLSRKCRLGQTLEVGAGCGLLGLVIAATKWAHKVILTETANVMDNLLRNIQRNASATTRAVARQLDWRSVERDAARAKLQLHTMDTILGTDVIFTPTLVEPLLRTLQFMAHQRTIVFMCVQVRCPDSHELLLNKAPMYGWEVTNVSSELSSIPECAWGLRMDIILLRLNRIPNKSGTVDNNERKRKSKTANTRRKKR